MPKFNKVIKATAEYTIDVDQLTIRDLVLIDKAKSTGNFDDMLKVFDRCLILPEGKTIFDLPARHYKSIINAIQAEMIEGDDVLLGN